MDGGERATFSLKALGNFRLQDSTGVVDLPSGKIVCLLTYLACTAPAPQPRERLATLLWGSSGEDRARHNLRQALSKLRQILGEGSLVSVGEAITLRNGLIDCDAATLSGPGVQIDPSFASRAADLYSGALLEDVFIDEAAWSEWLFAQREKLAEYAISVMVQHAENELKVGRPLVALQYGQRAVTLDRFREDAHRLVVAALAAAGRTPEAIRHFQGLAAFLRAELDTEPDEETRQLVTRLIDAGASKGLDSQSEGRTEPLVAPATSRTRPRGKMSSGPATGLRSDGEGRSPVAPNQSRRRQVTVLVCGPSASAQEVARLRPENRAEIISALRRRAADAAARFGGYVVPSADDVVQLYFGHLGSHHKDITHAVRVGMTLVAGIDDRSKADVALCAGISTGYTMNEKPGLSDSTDRPAAVGEAAALATRLQSIAPSGAVVVSDATRQLLGASFGFEAIDAAQERDAFDPSPAWLVHSEQDDDVAMVNWIREMAAPTKFSDGSYIFQVGEPPNQLYFLHSGTVLMEEIGLRVHSGDLFGEIGFFTQQTARTISARCEGPCEIICCGETDIVRQFLKDPVLSLNVLRLHAKRLVENPFPADRVIISSWRRDFTQ